MTSKRKNFTHENRSTRDLILDIAEQEIARKGVEGLKLKDVAEQVGVQLPSIYAHFAGRKEVLEALADRLMDELLIIYHEIKTMPPMEGLMASADRTIEFYVTHRGYARLLLADFPAPFEYSIFNRCSSKIQEVLVIVGDMINRGAVEGTVRHIPADLFLSFRMGITLFPLFMRSDAGQKEMVKDPIVIERIQREAHLLLSQFLKP
ncbi:MAG: TetR/AcrR family transcriptional regulator [Cohaesibacter sp.]|nr:TetR/AcrR family transcriptional regulator [Cohaesibacter sp.]